MKAEELRIGNFIENAAHNYIKITGYDIGMLSESKLSMGSCSAIPLTPEILEKAGFESNDIDDNWTIYEDEEKWIAGMNIKPHRNGYCFNPYGNEVLGVQCYYLHQLQNLYYALTGQELTINL